MMVNEHAVPGRKIKPDAVMVMFRKDLSDIIIHSELQRQVGRKIRARGLGDDEEYVSGLFQRVESHSPIRSRVKRKTAPAVERNAVMLETMFQFLVSKTL